MAPKYPRLAFTARDVQDLYELLGEHLSGVDTVIRRSPTKADSSRLLVVASGFRKVCPIGVAPRVEAIRYIAGKAQDSVDRAVFDVLWKLVNEVEAPCALWGTYTSLVETPPRRP